LHAVNARVATNDPLEDLVTTFASLAVPVLAIGTIGLWFVARPYGDRRWKVSAASALAGAGLALLVNQVISHLWARPRPYVDHTASTHLLASRSIDPSFPSDHAAAAFAIAFAVLAFSRRTGIAFLIMATLIAASRVALGLHYPTDVVAGGLVGWISAVTVTRPGGLFVNRLVAPVARLSDALVAPVWRRLSTRGSFARSP
jgi:undecaprenyl-diphosphatase